MKIWLKRFIIITVVLMFLGVTAVAAFSVGAVSGFFARIQENSLSEDVISGEEEEAKIGIIRMEGLILSSGPEDFFASSTVITPGEVKRWLREILKDDQVKAVVIELNSPGGSPVAADEIYKAMKTFRASGKSVVVVMEDTATSGAYYIAVAADRIIASPATLTGSIGVISEITNIEELLKKVGVSVEVYKSGKFKDFSSFARGRTDEEKKLIQEYIDTAYDMFVSRVSEGRNMDKTVVHGLAQGQIYSGNKALELRLIDGLGSVEDGVEEAKKLQNLTEVKIVRYRTQSALDVLLGRIETMVNPVSSLMARFTPGFRAAYLPSF
ncbi:MAG: hypothetical protein A2786_03825 [Candidatus Chisholmbacteria bacterium RIFCSPHIGHO2_01_FULL_52_32]|uniref:Peptidase S49 domain-containing protein n=1 Tax=Candidatus Chisholmbacteria bacterium RIFCSPHIGHO2_01_FULL_52_32 TaxID=1797591 RepID=A0A1G1VTB9_9BACT|nr:MAG: hypothetical protein A2786_03825 [Candidatus Chisholmbacteria bacterium RIFCSPHIGHO2_01_FULL_52_32]